MSLKTILFGITTFSVGVLFASGNTAIGIAPCAATPSPTSVATAAGTKAATTTGTLSTHAGTHDDPIPVGETGDVLINSLNGKDEFYLNLSQVQIGAKAEQAIAKGFFAPTPEPGNTYLIALVTGKFVKSDSNGAGDLNNTNFNSISDGQLSPDFLLVSPPAPALEFKGFAGAKVKGWIALPVASDDSTPLIVVGLNSFSGEGGTYFATQ